MATTRRLVCLPASTVQAIERLMESGIDNKRFGCPPGSMSEALKRLIIIGLEAREDSKP